MQDKINKQETLEEAAERYATGKSSSDVFKKAHIRDFIEGAKWQQEQDKNKFSVEEVKQMLIDCCGEVSCEDGVLLGKTIEELYCWIDEQFKNK
jgi:hypothetical protein